MNTAPSDAGYLALVLAGDRGADDPVARHVGAPCKALSPVAGIALLERVLTTLSQSPAISAIQVVGPSAALLDTHPELPALLERFGARWIAPGPSPSRSAAAALATVAPTQPVLLTTADHALLTGDMVEQMCARPDNADLGLGLVRHADVIAAYPDMRRTVIRLGREGGYCGCNLFALHTHTARQMITRWQEVETQRKHPARVIAGMLGWVGIVRYVTRRLSLGGALQRLQQKTGVHVVPVLLTAPEAAVDVDSVEDLRTVEHILKTRR